MKSSDLEEYLKILADFLQDYTLGDLTEVLDVEVMDILYAFEDEIVDNKEEIDELLGS